MISLKASYNMAFATAVQRAWKVHQNLITKYSVCQVSQGTGWLQIKTSLIMSQNRCWTTQWLLCTDSYSSKINTM